MPVKPQASSEIGPTAARDDGSPKTPDPTMFPITSAVAIDRPSERLSFGRAGVSVALAAGAVVAGMEMDMARVSFRWVATAIGPQHNYQQRACHSHPRWPAESDGKLRARIQRLPDEAGFPARDSPLH